MISSTAIIGVDPSLSATGIAYDNNQLATIKTKPDVGDHRLQAIYDAVYAAAGSGLWARAWRPTIAVIEDLPVNAMSAGKTGQAQGVVRMALVKAGASIISIAPATLKKYATGSGRATKKDMIAAWNDRHPDQASNDDNQVDAAWLREYGRDLVHLQEKHKDHLGELALAIKQNQTVGLPKSAAMDCETVERTIAGYQIV